MSADNAVVGVTTAPDAQRRGPPDYLMWGSRHSPMVTRLRPALARSGEMPPCGPPAPAWPRRRAKSTPRKPVPSPRTSGPCGAGLADGKG